MATYQRIYLSPSNQDANTYSYGSTNEMEQCNRIAEFAEIALKRNGFDVKRAPKAQNMYTSINESNSWGADWHIPIHTNAFNYNVTGGTYVILYQDTYENNKLGKAVLDEVGIISPGSDYALGYNTGFAELNSTNAVATYLEVEFHDTVEGAKWIFEHVEDIGEAICKAVCKANGKAYVPKEQPKPEVKPEVKPESKTIYRVQTGAFRNLSGAANFVKDLESVKINCFIVKDADDGLYKVQTGAFENYYNAIKMVDALDALGYDSFITTKQGTIVGNQEINNAVNQVELAVGDRIYVLPSAQVYGGTFGFDDWVYKTPMFVREIFGDRLVFSTVKTGPVTGAVNKKFVTKI